ncbi:MAG: peptide-methionine (R)-S-oxide reductase MsrB [Pseudomonadota bacterium]|nr:peptide-methionine (R)-S-oxide reductase MsrB [Pseudomonadota bacterium]
MNRRTLLKGLAAMVALPLLPAGLLAANKPAAAGKATVAALNRPKAYWRGKVSPAAYDVLFEEGTERAGSSPLDKEKRDGTFACAACQLPLFDSKQKFDSGTGWPSFTRSIAGHTRSKRDFKLILPRNEYHCARCGGHQGHTFNDGPEPLGKRWCNNGVALRFVPRNQPLPALRG